MTASRSASTLAATLAIIALAPAAVSAADAMAEVPPPLPLVQSVTPLGLVLTLQGVGAALSAGVANAVVGAHGHFGLAFAVLAGCALLAMPVFMLAQRANAREAAPRSA